MGTGWDEAVGGGGRGRVQGKEGKEEGGRGNCVPNDISFRCAAPAQQGRHNGMCNVQQDDCELRT
jgi:hypothetical protein